MKMKSIFQCLFIVSFLLTGCDDESYKRVILESPEDTMKIHASEGDTLVLSESKKDEVALTLEWGEAAYRGEGTELTYYFKMDIANNNFATSIPKQELPPDQRSISFTHEELNDLITKYWKKAAGTDVDIEAEIIADVTVYPKYMKPEVTKITLNVTSYVISPKNIYLIGSAAKNEDPAKATLLTNVSFNKEYGWRGRLEAGTFKFIESRNSLLPSYNKGENENTLVYRTEETDPDELFTVETSGAHSIYIDIEEMKITHTPLLYENVWMVGNATPAGWDINNPTPMVWSYKNPGIFTYEGEINAGEMKMPLWKGDWGADFLMPVVNNPEPTDNRVQLVPGGSPDNKWVISEAGNYLITLNVNDMTITFVKL